MRENKGIRKVLFARKVLLAAVFAVMCIGMSLTAQAAHTPVLKAACETYVTKDPRQVIIYVGDSRVMYATCGTKNSDARTNIAFCFVNGGNYSVAADGGRLTPMIDQYIRQYKDRDPIIVFNLGLNGNSNPKKNAKRLIKTYKWWMKKYPDLRFFVEGIGPTIVTEGSYSNANVIKLNELLRKEYQPKGMWIETYDFIEEKNLIDETGKGLRDRYHYKWPTSRKLLKHMRKCVEAAIAEEAAVPGNSSSYTVTDK